MVNPQIKSTKYLNTEINKNSHYLWEMAHEFIYKNQIQIIRKQQCKKWQLFMNPYNVLTFQIVLRVIITIKTLHICDFWNNPTVQQLFYIIHLYCNLQVNVTCTATYKSIPRPVKTIYTTQLVWSNTWLWIRTKSLWWWYVDTTTVFLDIIHHPLFI
jgi:hypothetical protein